MECYRYKGPQEFVPNMPGQLFRFKTVLVENAEVLGGLYAAYKHEYSRIWRGFMNQRSQELQNYYMKQSHILWYAYVELRREGIE